MRILKIALLFLLTKSSSCLSQISPDKKMKKISTSIAYIDELEMEVNNGGFNQYFLNSGQNCFETLKALKKNNKIKTAQILENAISLINPQKISEKNLILKLRNQKVEELNNEEINTKLYKLDLEFYKYPDGPLN